MITSVTIRTLFTENTTGRRTERQWPLPAKLLRRYFMFLAVAVSRSSSFLVWSLLPSHFRYRGLSFHLITLSDTYILGTTRLDEGSARHRDLCLATHYSQETVILTPGGVQTRNPRKRATADPRLSPHGQRDRRRSSLEWSVVGHLHSHFVTPLPRVFTTAIVTIFGSKFQMFIVAIRQITRIYWITANVVLSCFSCNLRI